MIVRVLHYQNFRQVVQEFRTHTNVYQGGWGKMTEKMQTRHAQSRQAFFVRVA